MRLALEEAHKAFAEDEVPVGAIVVKDKEIIGCGYNQKETLQMPTAHAEIFAIQQAAQTLKSWRLYNSILYTTMEPCPMCAGALVLARVETVVFAVKDPKGGACGTIFNIVNEPKLNHRINVISGICEEESRHLLQSFFSEKRKKKK